MGLYNDQGVYELLTGSGLRYMFYESGQWNIYNAFPSTSSYCSCIATTIELCSGIWTCGGTVYAANTSIGSCTNSTGTYDFLIQQTVDCGSHVDGQTTALDNPHYFAFNNQNLGNRLEIDLCGSSYDTYLYFRNATNLLKSNDDFCGLQSGMKTRPLSVGIHYIEINGFFGETGNYSLQVDCSITSSPTTTLPPTNSPTLPSFPIPIKRYITCGTEMQDETNSTERAHYYAFINAKQSANITISLCRGSDFDTMLYLLDKSLNIIESNDDLCGSQSKITANKLEIGIYLIKIMGYLGRTGTYTLDLICAQTTTTPTPIVTAQYILVQSPMTYHSARDYCNVHFDSSLASIHNADQNNEATAICGSGSCLIGLIDIDDERYNNSFGWSWADGSAQDYENWANGEPNNWPYHADGNNEDCVQLIALDGTWNDNSCYSQYKFLCNSIDPTTVIPTYHPTLPYPTTSPTLPTLPPTNSDKMPCGLNKWCYYINIYPLIGTKTSTTVAIANEDYDADTYFSIEFTPKENHCVNPTFTVIFEEIDYSEPNEFFTVFDDTNTAIQNCSGSYERNCGNWITCSTNQSLNTEAIYSNASYDIIIFQPKSVDALCNPAHEFSINLQLSLACAAGSLTPTVSPTTDPTIIPTPLPTLTPTDPTTAPTTSPTFTPREPCDIGLNASWCYNIDLFPSTNSDVSREVAITNEDQNVETYFYIRFTPRGTDCVYPQIAVNYEEIDYDGSQSQEYLKIYDDYGLDVNCGTTARCGLWTECIDRPLGINKILQNETYLIMVKEGYYVDALCSRYHLFSVNMLMTITCSSGTVAPSSSPTTAVPTKPTVSPTKAPTQKQCIDTATGISTAKIVPREDAEICDVKVIILNPDQVTIIPNKSWNITTPTQNSWHLKIELGNSWKFPSDQISKVTFTVNASCGVITDCDLIFAFSINDNKWFGGRFRMDNHVSEGEEIPRNQIAPKCGGLLNTGDINAKVQGLGKGEQRWWTGVAEQDNEDSYQYLEPSMNNNNQFPVSITIVNDPIQNKVTFEYTHNFTDITQSCTWNESIETNKGLDFYLSPDDDDEFLTIYSFIIQEKADQTAIYRDSYILIQEALNFTAAELFCNSKYGTNLASIHSPNENIEANDLCVIATGNCWIGSNDRDAESTFIWTDGSMHDYDRYFAGEPNGGSSSNCNHIWAGHNGSWADAGCSSVYPFLCNTNNPTGAPTNAPTDSPTLPSHAPSISSDAPTSTPTIAPTQTPSANPSIAPSTSPTSYPTIAPSRSPSQVPTSVPTIAPTITPSVAPSSAPSLAPTLYPSIAPSQAPSLAPSLTPTLVPSLAPSIGPTQAPSIAPSVSPTLSPSHSPSLAPTLAPSVDPSPAPSYSPTTAPTRYPTEQNAYDAYLDTIYRMDIDSDEYIEYMAKNISIVMDDIRELIERGYFDQEWDLDYFEFYVIIFGINGMSIDELRGKQYLFSVLLDFKNNGGLQLNSSIRCENSICNRILVKYNEDEFEQTVSTFLSEYFIRNTVNQMTVNADIENQSASTVQFFVDSMSNEPLELYPEPVESTPYVTYGLLSITVVIALTGIFGLVYNKKADKLSKLPGCNVVDDGKWIAIIVFALQFWDFGSDVNLASEIVTRDDLNDDPVIFIIAIGAVFFTAVPYISNLVIATRIKKIIKHNEAAKFFSFCN